jgi:hypothetical protein
MSATLIRRGWLVWGIEFSLSDGAHIVEYDGRCVADKISVDGLAVSE